MKIQINIPEVFAKPIEKEFDKEHVTVCWHCSGLGFMAESLLTGKKIEYCNTCGGTGYTHYLGECGEMHETTGTFCYKCFEKKEEENDKKAYEKAKKIKAKDYEGKVAGIHGYVEDIDDYLEEYKENFEIDSPKWIFGVKMGYKIGFDLLSAIESEIHDNGYEDMVNDVDIDSDKLEQAQKLIDEWAEEEKSNSSYDEDRSLVIDLSDVYEECLKKIKKTKEELAEKLCDYCHAKDMKLTQFSIGCEANWCNSAYENYLESEEE